MKMIGLILGVFFLSTYLSAQEQYIVNGKSLQLKMEVEGQLDLLWGVIDGRFHYYVRTSDDTITELLNTKKGRRQYEEEYKDTLKTLTQSSAEDVNLNLLDLKVFIDNYNASQDPNYEPLVLKKKLELLHEIFGGITNSPFVKNETNSISPQFGAELEVGANESRHALFLQARHVFESNDFKYETTEFALGYRFRVVNSEAFRLYAQTKFGTLNFLKNTVFDVQGQSVELKETGFNIPLTLGLGADIRIGKSGFVSVQYNELFAALLDNQDNFSNNITLGYKFSL